jgi:hypothetical protein
MVPDKPASITLTPMTQPLAIKIDWTAPLNSNGDNTWGYRVYLDNGRGGPFTLIFDTVGYSSIYSYTTGQTENVDCGYLYNVQVTAINTAGEGMPI